MGSGFTRDATPGEKTMGKNLIKMRSRVLSRVRVTSSPRDSINNKGQALVEYTLCFLLLLVIAWIPADFGLAFYTSQLASNAAREGARIGSATVGLGTVVVGGITYPTLNSTNFSDIATETCRRLPSALLKPPTGGGWTTCSPWGNAGVKVALIPGSGTCNEMVEVTVGGTYNYFFYQLFRLMGSSANLNTTPMTRVIRMRWEHQSC